MCFSLFFAALSSQPIPSFYNGVFWSSRGTVGSPVLPFCKQSTSCTHHSVSLISIFSHYFLLSALILLKIPGWPSSLGCAKVCPSRHPFFLHFPLFPFLSHSGGILFCQLESRLLSFFFLCFPVLVPRGFFCLCHERSLGSTSACVLLLLFLVFLLLSFSFELS